MALLSNTVLENYGSGILLSSLNESVLENIECGPIKLK